MTAPRPPDPAEARRLVLAAVAVCAALAGCGRRAAPPPAGRTRPAPPRRGYTETGTASYYAEEFHGRKTSSGEVYSRRRLTAAHRKLPFGTRLRVTNLANGRRVVVRVNDRGPFRKGRILDLSLAAARELGMVRAGLARVRIEVVK